MITRSMKLNALRIFRSKLFKPFTKFLFKLRLKKPAFIRALGRRYPRHRRHKPFFFFFNPIKPMSSSSPSSFFSSVFRSPKKSKHTNKFDQCPASPSIDVAAEAESAVVLPSSPPPRYGKGGGEKREGWGEEVEEACRRFERCLVEMVVEEGKTKELMDVEELLCCWKKLKCPVFIDLVSRFYGELCKDLFSSSQAISEEVPLPH